MNLTHIRLLIFSGITALCVIIFLAAIHSGIKPADISTFSLFDSHASASSQKEVNREKLAYMTFLAGTTANLTDADITHDRYFDAARMLGYQLLHHESTKTQQNIPFIVLVTDDISEEKRERLTKDGVTVIPVEYIVPGEWLHATVDRWKDVVTKLRAWQLTQYSRILFIDGDTIINRCLDDIFQDPAAQFKPLIDEAVTDTEGERTLISDYVIASLPETRPDHDYPPHEDQYRKPDYMTAGFFMFSPSIEMFDYYVSLMAEPGHFNPNFPEQNLLNYAHRLNGTVPWQRLAPTWNINFPKMYDMESGVATMHEKWWGKGLVAELHDHLLTIRWSMQGFYEARDLALTE